MSPKKKKLQPPFNSKIFEDIANISIDSLDQILDSKFLNSLSDPTRITVLKKVIQLGRGDVSQIADGLPWDKSVVSRNLAYLNEAGILKRTKIGKQVFYEPDIENIIKRLRAITEGIEMIVSNCCPEKNIK
ncbi:MAG: helix-turn-helix transcriptional regulator [Leptospira sp.]|nr:helix-turn-helix transcriptional regulator [Leptospira sp.]